MVHFDLTLLTNLGNVSGRKETLPGRVVTRRHRTNCDLDFIGFNQFNSQTYMPHNVSFKTFRLPNFGCDVNSQKYQLHFNTLGQVEKNLKDHCNWVQI